MGFQVSNALDEVHVLWEQLVVGRAACQDRSLYIATVGILGSCTYFSLSLALPRVMNCPVNPAIEALLKPTHYNPLATDIQKWIRDMEILFDADGIPDVDTKQPFYAVNYITEDFRTEIEAAVKSAQEKSKDAQEKLKIVRAKSKSAQEESESVQEKLEGIQKEYEVAIYWPQFKRFMIEFDRECYLDCYSPAV